MRTSILSALVCLGFLLLVAAGGDAALIYEPFNYLPVGADLTGQSPNGGVNVWNVTGTGTAGADQITMASVSPSVTGLPPSIGNCITFGGRGLTKAKGAQLMRRCGHVSSGESHAS